MDAPTQPLVQLHTLYPHVTFFSRRYIRQETFGVKKF
jgi:hypothetical protein